MLNTYPTNNITALATLPAQAIAQPTKLETVPRIFLESYGFEVITENSETEGIPIVMGIKQRGNEPIDIDNLKLVTQQLFAIHYGIHWTVGDLLNMFPKNRTEILQQIAPITHRGYKTMKNWATTAKTYHNIYHSGSQQILIDKVLRDGELMVWCEHIGTYRHQNLDFTAHKDFNEMWKGDELDIRGIVMVNALQEDWNVSDMKQHRDLLMAQYAKDGSQSIRNYLANQRKRVFAVDNPFSKTVSSFSFHVAKGTSYTDVLAMLRAHAQVIATHAQENDVLVKSKVAK